MDGRTRSQKWSYLPARRCQRGRFSIFFCFFLRMRLRRFLISEPMRGANLQEVAAAVEIRDERGVGVDALADDVEAGAPERFVVDVDAEAAGELGGVAEAGGREQVVVALAELV